MREKLSTADIASAVSNIAPRHGIVRAYLFGSYARGEASDSSDVDLVIESERPLGFARGGVFNDLERILGCPVDVVFGADALYPFVRDSFEREKVMVYGK